MSNHHPISAYGNELNARWKIGAHQTRYRRTGDFFMMLKQFPGALCDANGFIRFETIEDLSEAHGVKVYQNTQRISVPGGISNLLGYKLVPSELQVS
jgi:hypothetical protein